MNFKIRQLPIVIDTSEPEFGMMKLYAGHELAEAWLVCFGVFFFKTIESRLQCFIGVCLIAGGCDREQHDQECNSHTG